MNQRKTFNPELAFQIGKILKERRIENGLTILQFAALVPASQGHIRKWEKGESLFYLSKFVQVIRALDMKFSDFNEVFERYCI